MPPKWSPTYHQIGKDVLANQRSVFEAEKSRCATVEEDLQQGLHKGLEGLHRYFLDHIQIFHLMAAEKCNSH